MASDALLEIPSLRETSRRRLVALGCFLGLISVFSPRWGACVLRSRGPEWGGMLAVRRDVSVLAPVTHPGVAIGLASSAARAGFEYARSIASAGWAERRNLVRLGTLPEQPAPRR
jgi:hypothetical protein